MATTVKRLTYDDLESITQEREGDRHEIIDGELVVTPAPIPNHESITMNIIWALSQVARENKLGRLYTAPIDVRFSPDNVHMPDIIFIARERRRIVGAKVVEEAPDLVVEILSPGTRRRDQGVKRELYARFGVREYWIVDPDEPSVTVLVLTDGEYVPLPVGEDGTIRSNVFPGLDLTVEAVFAVDWGDE